MKYFLAVTGHFIFTVLILKSIVVNLPNEVTEFYAFAFSAFLCIAVSVVTFGITKRMFLNSKINTSNKAVLITGSASGFGFELAKRLDSKGFLVFASCRSLSDSRPKSLQASCSSRLKLLELNVTDEESVKKAVEFVKSNLGSCELWAVVNNAGVFKGRSTEFTSIEEYKQVMEVNAFGVVRVTKAFLPLLRQTKGRIVNISSIAARFACPHLGAYTMSKFAALAFNDSLRNEMKVWGIKVISIEPEIFQTPMSSPEAIQNAYDIDCTSLEEDLRTVYGEEYFKKTKIYSTRFANASSPKVYIVLNAIESAITLVHPDIVYMPTRSIFLSMIINAYLMLPDVLRDIAFSLGFYGVPRPKKADKL